MAIIAPKLQTPSVASIQLADVGALNITRIVIRSGHRVPTRGSYFILLSHTPSRRLRPPPAWSSDGRTASSGGGGASRSGLAVVAAL